MTPEQIDALIAKLEAERAELITERDVLDESSEVYSDDEDELLPQTPNHGSVRYPTTPGAPMKRSRFFGYGADAEVEAHKRKMRDLELENMRLRNKKLQQDMATAEAEARRDAAQADRKKAKEAAKAQRDAENRAKQAAREQLRRTIAVALPMATPNQRTTLFEKFAGTTPTDQTIQLEFVALPSNLTDIQQDAIVGKMMFRGTTFAKAYKAVVGTTKIQSSVPPTSSSIRTITPPPSDYKAKVEKLVKAFGPAGHNMAATCSEKNASITEVVKCLKRLPNMKEAVQTIISQEWNKTHGTGMTRAERLMKGCLAAANSVNVAKASGLITSTNQSPSPSSLSSSQTPTGFDVVKITNAPGLKQGTATVVRSNDMFNRGQIVINTPRQSSGVTFASAFPAGTMLAADGLKYDAGYLALGQAGAGYLALGQAGVNGLYLEGLGNF